MSTVTSAASPGSPAPSSPDAPVGANVVIQGTSVGAATDLEGNFQINALKPGTYIIVVSSITYRKQTIADVVVESGNTTSLQIVLIEDVSELEEIVVTAKKEITTDLHLISAIRHYLQNCLQMQL